MCCLPIATVIFSIDILRKFTIFVVIVIATSGNYNETHNNADTINKFDNARDVQTGGKCEYSFFTSVY